MNISKIGFPASDVEWLMNLTGVTKGLYSFIKGVEYIIDIPTIFFVLI